MTKTTFFKMTLLAIVMMAASVTLFAQTTSYGWDGTNVNSTSGTNANITSAVFGSAQGNNNGTTPLISTTSASTGYTGSTGTSNFGAACKTGALTTSTSTYFTTVITPATNYKVTLNSISLGSRGTSTGPTTITVYSSIDNYTTAIGSATVLANSTWALSSITFSGSSLTGSVSTAVTLRIYGSGGAGSANVNTANWRIDDISLNVTAVANGGPICTASNLAFSPTTVNKTIGDAAFTQTATSLNGTTAISYSSNNTGVATVDPVSGLVTLVAAGTATIAATQTTGTHNAVDYCAATATYTLNVASTTPTLTITEVTVPAFAANVGSTSTKTVNVSGVNLSANVTLALSGTNADQFSLSQYSVTQTGGTASNTVITITYTPTTTGTHTATLTLSSTGAMDVTRSLSATAGLTTPVANQPSAQNNSSFTANWDAISGATDYLLSVYTKTGGGSAATDLFISEYVEGTSNNKAIEIFNGTGAPVDLSAYSLKKQTNGANVYTTEQLLTGTLVNNDVYVLANTSANATILGVADLTNNTTMTFNGNDAVALFKNGTQIDEVGIFNQVAIWGADQTLIRKSSITSPKATYDVADWDVQATDYITNLGSHTMTGSSNVQVSGSPFTVTGTNSYALSGLQGGSTYYYTVVAKNATVTTVASNEVAASTLGTGLSSTLNSLSVSASDGLIRFTAESGRVIELYNAVGQKLLIKQTVDGLNSIPVSAKGLVVLKMGNQIAKVVL